MTFENTHSVRREPDLYVNMQSYRYVMNLSICFIGIYMRLAYIWRPCNECKKIDDSKMRVKIFFFSL